MKQLTILISVFLLSSYNTCFAQQHNTRNVDKPFTLGIIQQIQSAQLGELRTLNIYLPENYRTDTAHYPVLYLLDASANEDFIHIVGLVQFLNMIQLMPPTIVVGIANVDRRRDFTFPSTVENDKKLVPTSGGSEKFINFIESELQPYIQIAFRTTTEKTIIGQSLGGLLASEILVKRPQLFNNYIIVSPSLWWNKESLLNLAEQHLKKNTYSNTKVYIGVGAEGAQMENDAAKLAALLKQLPGVKTYFDRLPKESHLTILHRCVYNAIEILDKKETVSAKKK